jgi:DNA-binding transcriptional LysR family regulator
MELRHLRYFIAVAELENVSRAALLLHVSQPALSRQVRDLEEELGFALLERRAKSVRLTEAGREFLLGARAVLACAEEAVKAARGKALGAGGEFHVGYAPTPTVRFLPPTLRAFQQRMPGLRVKLHDLSTVEMLAGLREGRLQLAFLAKPLRRMLRGVEFEELERDEMLLAVPPGHAFAKLKSVGLERAAGEPFVVLGSRDYPEYHEFLDAVFAPLKRAPRIVAEHDGAASLMAEVESGCGVALVSRSMACTAGARLRFIPLRPEPARLVIGAAWLKGRAGLPVGQFLACAREAIAGNA